MFTGDVMLKDKVGFLQQLADALILEINKGHLQTANELSGKKAGITAACLHVKKTWSGLLFSQAKDYAIRRYTWFQQQSLLELTDTLYDRVKQHEQAALQTGNAPVLSAVSFLLEQLLILNHFLVHYFNSYINQDINMPKAAIPDARKKMAESAERLSASLQTLELDVQLKACLLDYLQGIVTTDHSSPLTYRSREYLVQFTGALNVAIAFEDKRDLTFSVMETLFYMNFNHHGFCHWYREKLTREKEQLKPSDQLPVLKKQLLALKTMRVILTMSYDPELLPVNTLLENWLSECIKEEQLQPDRAQKIELTLTVAQLALLIRLLYEEGVFAMKNIAGLLRFFSGHFMSKKQEHISYGSMNKLYYSGDQFTGYAVKELLLKMVAKINKMFFPS